MFHIKSTSKSVQTIINDLTAAAEKHQFGVLHEHNIRQTMRRKGVEFPHRVRVLEICNPPQILDDPGIHEDVQSLGILPHRKIYDSNPKLDPDLGSGQWPLIEYLYADEIYRAQYDVFVAEVIDGAFNTSVIQATYAAYASLIEPYATSEIAGHTFLNRSADFQRATSELSQHASERASAVGNYLE